MYIDLLRKFVSALLCVTCAASLGWAQQPQDIQSEKPKGSVFIRPYKAAVVPPIQLHNSLRLPDLIRGGKLYLTAQDAIALALENNVDIEFDRYNALIDQWSVIRQEGGGALPGVPSGSSQVKTVTNGQGVAGAQAGAGVGTGSKSFGGTTTVGGSISAVGTTVPTFDPVFQASVTPSHQSAPQYQQTLSNVFNLVSDYRTYTSSISEGLVTGGSVSLSYQDQYLNENSPVNLLNPSTAPTLSLSLRQNLGQGFGIKLNSRNITVAKANLKINDLNFKTEVIAAVVNVLNLYYGLVADYEDLRAKQDAVNVAQRFYEDNKKQVQIGTMAPLDVTTAEAQLASSQQDLAVSQATLAQQEVSLKNVLSRTGLSEPLLREVEVVPLDRIVVPEKDDLPPTKDLIATAHANRVDIQAEALNLINDQTNALNTQNGVLPSIVVLATASAQGLSGAKQYYPISRNQIGLAPAAPLPPGFVPCPASKGVPSNAYVCAVPDASLVGGIGTALGQMIRRDYPSESIGGYIAPTIHNRMSVADQITDQLSLRQAQLQHAKNTNEIAVDVSNQVIGLQQARVRYQAAVRNRILQQELLDSEQKKFKLGASTSFLVVQQQRDLATAQSSEVAALVAYFNARVGLDQTLGTTLQSNHVSLEEAQNGHVARRSTLPEKLPEQP
jgi:outer membrane protein TolC